jgi:hypothetical protein
MRAIDRSRQERLPCWSIPAIPAAGSRVTGAIRQASQATGASFNYLLAKAQVESGLDPQAGVTVAKIDGDRASEQ